MGVYRGVVRSVLKVDNYSVVKNEKNRDRCDFVGNMVYDSKYLNTDVSDYPFGNGGAIRYINL